MNAAFDLKSTRLDALTLRLTDANWQAAHTLLQQKIEQYQLFNSMPFVLDISVLNSRQEGEGLADFVAQIQHKGLYLIALRHDTQNWSKEAVALKLLFQGGGKRQPENNGAQTASSDDTLHTPLTVQANMETDEQDMTHIVLPENLLAADAVHDDIELSEQTLFELNDTARRTVVINSPVRTGQQVYAEDADLIVLGMVSEGAEVIADGNIHVYAPLRGRALAGEKGDKSARIFVQSMQAELVSIAGIYRVFEQKLPAHLHKQAVRVELVEERLSVAAIEAQ